MEASASSDLSNDDMLFNMGGQHMMRDRYQGDILQWVKDNKVEITEVDCDLFILNKILVGDKSDNIPSVVTWQKEMKNGKLRNYSITDKTANKIIDQFLKEHKDFKIDYLFSKEAKQSICDIIYRVVGHSNLALIQANLNSNISLMLLHTKTIPDAIQSAIYETIDREWEGAVDNIEVLLDKDKILEGTDWLKGSSTPASVDPFANMEIPEEPIKKVEGKKEIETNPKTRKLSDLF
jgi:hypothetical protein